MSLLIYKKMVYGIILIQIVQSLIMKKAIKCSVARCARVSYLNHDNENPDIDKDIALADMFVSSRTYVSLRAYSYTYEFC